MKHPFLMFLDHTQRRSTVGRIKVNDVTLNLLTWRKWWANNGRK